MIDCCVVGDRGYHSVIVQDHDKEIAAILCEKKSTQTIIDLLKLGESFIIRHNYFPNPIIGRANGKKSTLTLRVVEISSAECRAFMRAEAEKCFVFAPLTQCNHEA